MMIQKERLNELLGKYIFKMKAASYILSEVELQC